jgi:hypothetical protein
MKYIETENISNGTRAPYSARTHDHYKEAIKEVGKALALAIGADPSTLTILAGVKATENGYTEGWAFYDGEICFIPESTGLADAANASINETVIYRDGDPVLFTDNNLRNLHAERRFIVTDAEGIIKVSAAPRIATAL